MENFKVLLSQTVRSYTIRYNGIKWKSIVTEEDVQEVLDNFDEPTTEAPTTLNDEVILKGGRRTPLSVIKSLFGSGVPDGGTTGQVLSKQSNENGDVIWTSPDAVPVTKENVSDAIDSFDEVEEITVDSEIISTGGSRFVISKLKALFDTLFAAKSHTQDISTIENFPEIPSIEGLATEQYVTNYSQPKKSDSELYVSAGEKSTWNEKANTSDIPLITGLATVQSVTDETTRATAAENGLMKSSDYVGLNATGYVRKADFASDADRAVSDGDDNTITSTYATKEENAGKENSSNKGANNGYAGLDSNSKLLLANLPDSILGQVKYKGTYTIGTNLIVSDDSTLNSHALPTSTTSTNGFYFIVQDSGTVNGFVFNIGDWIISDGVAGWSKVDNTDAISTVNGHTGTVILDASDIAETTTLKWLTSTLKGFYDTAYNWVNTNGTNLLNHLSRTDNPHNVTKAQIGLPNVSDGAQVNVIESVSVNGITIPLNSKNADLTILKTWVTAIVYKMGNSFVSASKIYRVLADHTSTTIAADLASNNIELIGGVAAPVKVAFTVLGNGVIPFSKYKDTDSALTVTKVDLMSNCSGASFTIGATNYDQTSLIGVTLPINTEIIINNMTIIAGNTVANLVVTANRV